jgi:hypothetical protein
LKKNNANNYNSNSYASHGEVDNREMQDSGISGYGGYGAPAHFSNRQHQQKHQFNNANEGSSDSYLDSAYLDRNSNSALKKRQNMVDFGKLFQNSEHNDDSLQFANDNNSIKRKKGNSYQESQEDARNINRNNNLRQNNVNQNQMNEDESRSNGRDVHQLNKKTQEDFQSHDYSTKDHRNKEITNANGH